MISDSNVTDLYVLTFTAATPELEAKLNSIMKSFCYACDNYAKVSLDARKLARL